MKREEKAQKCYANKINEKNPDLLHCGLNPIFEKITEKVFSEK